MKQVVVLDRKLRTPIAYLHELVDAIGPLELWYSLRTHLVLMQKVPEFGIVLRPSHFA